MTREIAADALDLAALLRPGDNLVIAQGPSLPQTLVEALVAQHAAIGPMQAFVGPVFIDAFPPETTAELTFRSYGAIGRGAARLAKAGRLEVLPVIYSALPGMFADGTLPADVLMLQMAPAEKGPDGRLGLGLNHDYAVDAGRRARLVIAEVNDQVPWVPGGSCPSDLRIDIAVRVSRPPIGMPSSAFGPTEEALARHVAALIPDGGVIQTGIGSIPDAILVALAGHRDLGIHSGMIGDRFVDLIERGAVTNARKAVHAGISVTNVVLGTARSNDFTHRNPAVLLLHPNDIHHIEVLARIADFIAINGAVEVDLTGQINAESADGSYVGAVGGQADFVRGAMAAPRGKSLIVLPATARKGTRSRIVTRLDLGTVTTPRSDADFVVTEHGVAALRGLDLSQRARAMIAIAAPDFREDLARDARDILGLRVH